MVAYRYWAWDGTQEILEPEPDALMKQLERTLMNYGDLNYAIRQMQRNGIEDESGRRLPGIQELLQRLRDRRQEQLSKYDLGSMMAGIREKLDNITRTERRGIEKLLRDARERARSPEGELPSGQRERLLKALEEMSAQRLRQLDALPHDPAGQLKALSRYDFVDPDARRQFQELMDDLKRQAMQSYGRDLIQQVKTMDAQAMAGVRNLVEAINQMLEQRLRGGEPDYPEFLGQFGDYFGPDSPRDLSTMIERLQQQMAQAASLLNSLSTEDRQQLEELVDSMLDEATKYELAKMAANLERLSPSDEMRKRYAFSGEESISLDQAMKLMERLQLMDRLEDQLRESQLSRSIDAVDEDLMRQLVGSDAAEQVHRLKGIDTILEEAGYIRTRDGKYELTPRGMRKIGQKALEDIFARLRKDHGSGHWLNARGQGGERIEETMPFRFGDDFLLHLQNTVMNAIRRGARGVPVALEPADFEVYRTEAVTRSATVLMLDLSLSMPMRGNFQAAKKVAVALDNLIRTQYPRDSLYIVGFSSYARRIKKEDLSYMNWDEFDPYTNMQHGFAVAQRLLARERCQNKQIILISDGEPTAHFEGEQIYFQYPPSLRTLQVTLREVRQCTRKGIVINTFMLDSGRFLGSFVTEMARINRGRIFFTNADSLGQYLLVDYIGSKHTRKVV